MQSKQKGLQASETPTMTTTTNNNNNNNNGNPHALATAQEDDESFEVMQAPPADFDIYKDRPQSTGRCKARKLAHRDADWHRSVHVWIVDIDSIDQSKRKCKILLQQRSPHKDTFPNRWDISAAGHIEAGTTDSKATAVREVQEELGLDNITVESLIFAFTCPAEQAPIGGCNCYEDCYFLIRKQEDRDPMD